MGFLLPQQAEAGVSQTCEVTVETHDSAGIPFEGMFMQFNLNGGQTVFGFSTHTIALECGVEHQVTVAEFPPVTFNSWLDTGSTDSSRFFTVFEDTTFTAHMNKGNFADLAVTVDGAPDLVTTQGNADWTSTVTNNGPTTAQNVLFVSTGTISTGTPTSPDIALAFLCDLTFDLGCTAASLLPGQCAVLGTPSGNNGATCNLGNMAPLDTITVDSRTEKKSGAFGDMLFTATVSSDTFDPDGSNNSDSLTVTDNGPS